MELSKVIIHENKDEYLPEEIVELEQAWRSLVAKSQGEELSLEEVRIIVAYKRYQQEGNFKIVAEKAVKAARVPKQPKEPKAPREKKPKALTKRDMALLLTMRDLLEGGQITLDSLPQDRQDFYELNKDKI